MAVHPIFKSPTFWLEAAVAVGGITLAALQGKPAGSFGRRYAASEWVEFFSEPGNVTQKMQTLSRRFTDAVRPAFHAWALENGLGDVEFDMNAVAYRAYASLVGHGIGLWDGEILVQAGLSRERADELAASLDAAMKASATLSKLGHELDDLISMARERGESKRERARR